MLGNCPSVIVYSEPHFVFYLVFVKSSVVTTFLEIKADTFKLLFLYKRPVPRCGVNGSISIVVDRSFGVSA